MSKVTYFTARQKVLEVLAAGANIPFTSVDCSLFVPVGATAIVAMTELEVAVPGGGNQYAISQKRKDLAQGVCSSDQVIDLLGTPTISGDNAIIPLTALRAFEYDLNGIYGLGIVYNIRVWAIGYIS